MKCSRYSKGRLGEDLALDFLLNNGLSLRNRNCRVGHKEMDLVMESESHIHIVEVKSIEKSGADPSEKVDETKIRRLTSAAGEYVAVNHISKEVQFDVVTIVFDGTDFDLEYLPNAFYPIYYR